LGEDDSWKKSEAKHLVTLSLKVLQLEVNGIKKEKVA
jgi:hypothetical protein